jgi:hypothetical protein
MLSRHRLPGLLLAAWLTMTWTTSAQTQSEIWRAFAQTMPVGTELTVKLRSGQRFRATLIAARDADALLQPRTRVPVPVQPVPYDTIVLLEKHENTSGAGKAAAIGVAAGAGAFLAMLLVLLVAA